MSHHEKFDRELDEMKWPVTENVNPTYFSPDLQFQNPDVKLSGIDEYARAVNKLFDQNTSRAEIISTTVTSPTTITVTWRLSGKVKIRPGLNIKPYICYTDFLLGDQGFVSHTFKKIDLTSPGGISSLAPCFPS